MIYLVAAAYVTFINVGQLLDQCAKPDPRLCQGYIMAAADSIDMSQYVFDKKVVCLPSDITLGKLTDVSISYLRANPDIQSEPAVAAIQLALMQAFPCGGVTKKP